MQADELGQFVAEHPRHGLVGVEEQSLVMDGDAFLRHLEELAEALLAFAQRLLRLPAFGDVGTDGEGANHPAVAILQAAHVPQQAAPAAIRRVDGVLEPACLPAGHDQRKIVVHCRPQLARQEQLEIILPQHLGTPAAVETLGLGIEFENAMLGRQHDDDVERGLHDGPEPGLVLQQRFLGAPALADVVHEPEPGRFTLPDGKGHGNLDRDWTAVPGHKHRFIQRRHRLAGLAVAEALRYFFVLVRMHQLLDAGVADFLEGIAEHRQ